MMKDSVAYYDRNAERFAADTGGVDMSALHERFLRYVPAGGRILDAGCGVGRDARAFTERGFAVVGFDASAEMVRLARERVGTLAEIRHMRFEDVAWRGEFDGIWACASLLHLPPAAFPGVASQLVGALRPGGAWYMSFKLGVGERRDAGRLFVDHTEASLRAALSGLQVRPVEPWTTADVRPGRTDVQWLNAITLKL
ncbi:class I SAM-dependent methyltransferase [Roseomonas nepalensis]|uniref:Class I SAM-dependent methyltransferase n=1 Tax=Muricoccus nepalensis TaxID=1854500 RepID=A0A502G926_9PROT|nr:class I SAM-dependent methyltransferase [Roseomonas nepalensis]TPG57830.1 class I SAM-dependent methyltransferase [Roseomonas nepalensis]